MKNLLDWALDRLSEQSTWKGIIGLLTAAGATLKPEQATGIIAAGIALTAMVNVFRNEKASTAAAVQTAIAASNTATITKP